MGQKLYTDRIGALSFSSPNIILQPSILTIGGQQYVTTTALNVAPSGLASASLYMIYAVQTAGIVSLVISTNVNSVGPSGYSSWKLVGAFYSSGDSPVAFGAFVTIEGTPTSGSIPFTPSIVGFSSLGIVGASFTRVGNRIIGQVRGSHGSSVVTEVRYGLPGSMTGGPELGASPVNVGKYNLSAVNNASDEYVLLCLNGQSYFTVGEQRSNSGLTGVTSAVLAGGVNVSYNFNLPITGLDHRPLKDL